MVQPPAAGRPLRDEAAGKGGSCPATQQFRQQHLFEFGISSIQNPEGGATKQTSDFVDLQYSTLWGDPQVSRSEVVSQGIFRLLSHNVHGLSARDNSADLTDFAKAVKAKGIAAFGIQEPNRNFERRPMLDDFNHRLRQVSSHYRGQTSSARLGFGSNYQPGGTAVAVRNEWATRYLASGSDNLGRWSWITLAGTGTTKVTLISVYRVCDGGAEASITTRTVRAQQEWMYAARGKGPINLRQQVVTDLVGLINKLKDEGHDIVLMIDANEASGNGTAVDRFLLDCGMVDAHTLCVNEPRPPPPTHQSGSVKIDFVLITPRLRNAVIAASILPYCDGYLSDHRALVVDFDALEMFGDTTSPIVSPMDRRLTSTNPKAVHIYITAWRIYLAAHNLVQRVDELQKSSKEGKWCDESVMEYEVIDQLLSEGRSMGENKCPPKNSGAYPWTPDLDLAGVTLLYWKMRRRDFFTADINAEEISALEEYCGITPELRERLSSSQVLAQVQRAKKELRKIQKKSDQLRVEFLTEMAKLAASLKHCPVSKALQEIQLREKMARKFRTLRKIFKPGKSSGLDRIDVPNEFAVRREGEEVPRIPLVVREDIGEVLLPHTKQRFQQHQETPFGRGARQQRMGSDCTSDDTQRLLEGTYDWELESLTQEARDWLQQLKRTNYVNAGSVISTTVTADEWIAGWKKMTESTASGGAHFGHYKTAAVAASLPKKHPDYLPELADIYSIMHSLPLKHGFSPKRWQHCVDAVLEKIPGRPIIEKLRIIMLFEADFNFMLKVVWGRRLIRHAESNQALGNENHGSRQGRQSQDASLQKALLYAFARLSRTNLVTVDNDAKSCYDRIIKALAMIACIAYGLPLLAAVMHNRTHHGMKHSVKSRHGLFDPYSGADGDELEGTGQGSGGSPGIWLIYSVTLLLAFRQHTKGMHVVSPFETLLVLIIAILYVDDGMPGVNDADQSEPVPLETLTHQAQSSAQSWERLLFASGGALELNKCFTYFVYWDLEAGKHRLMDPSEIPGCEPEGDHFRGPISLTYGDASEERHLIETESPWVGRRTIGVRVAPAGNWDDEFNFRREQSRELAILAAGTRTTHDTARTGYSVIVCPKLEFPLAVTEFTQDQCDMISSPILRVFLPKMGYNRNMPREVVYGPVEMGGLGLHDFYIEQGIRQISALVGHLRQNSETGRMMRIELEWCQIQAGTSEALLLHPQSDIDYVETCWIMSIRDFLRTYRLRLEFTEASRQQPQCEQDCFIMDSLREHGQFSATEMQQLNACRMYLQVSRLSDIVTGDGRHILREVLVGSDTKHHLSSNRWPRQGRPIKEWWNLWRRALQRVFSIDGVSRTIRTPLGLWHHSINQSEWSTLVTTTPSLTAYVRGDNGSYSVFQEAERGQRSRRSYVQTAQVTVVDNPPSDAVPATLGPISGGRRQVLFRARTAIDEREQAGDPATFAEFVARQPSHISQLLQYSDVSEEGAQRMADVLQSSGSLKCGTDGGALAGEGTFGFVWAAARQFLADGCGRVPGRPYIMSSTRTELCGLLAAITYLRLVIEYHTVTVSDEMACTIFCDSKAALSRVAKLKHEGFGTTWRCRHHYDLEAAIRTCISSLPIKLQWSWVRGHADRTKKADDLTFAETLNCEADGLATLGRQCDPLPDLEHWPEQEVSVVGPNGPLLGRLATELRYCCTIDDLRSYYQDRYDWSADQYEMVDETGIRQAMSKLKGGAKRRVQQLRCGWLPVNRRVARTDPDRHDGCPACTPTGELEETVDHIFQCPQRVRRTAMLKGLEGLHDKFREWKTAYCIIGALTAGATAWIEGRDIPPVESLQLPDTDVGRLTGKAYVEQTQLGWNVLFRGFWTVSWREAQESVYEARNIREPTDTGTATRSLQGTRIYGYCTKQSMMGFVLEFALPKDGLLILPFNYDEFYDYGPAASTAYPTFFDEPEADRWDPATEACEAEQLEEDYTGVDSLSAFFCSILVFVTVQLIENARGGKALFTFPGLEPYEKDLKKHEHPDETNVTVKEAATPDDEGSAGKEPISHHHSVWSAPRAAAPTGSTHWCCDAEKYRCRSGRTARVARAGTGKLRATRWCPSKVTAHEGLETEMRANETVLRQAKAAAARKAAGGEDEADAKTPPKSHPAKRRRTNMDDDDDDKQDYFLQHFGQLGEEDGEERVFFLAQQRRSEITGPEIKYQLPMVYPKIMQFA